MRRTSIASSSTTTSSSSNNVTKQSNITSSSSIPPPSSSININNNTRQRLTRFVSSLEHDFEDKKITSSSSNNANDEKINNNTGEEVQSLASFDPLLAATKNDNTNNSSNALGNSSQSHNASTNGGHLDDNDNKNGQEDVPAVPSIPLPPHKKAYPMIYDEKTLTIDDKFHKELAKMFDSQFAHLHLTPAEHWGVDDEEEMMLLGGAVGGDSNNNANGNRNGKFHNQIRNNGTFNVLSRLAGTRNPAEIATGVPRNNNVTNTSNNNNATFSNDNGAGIRAAFLDNDHKLTFTSDGATGSGQRIGETAPPTVLLTITTHPVRPVGGMLLIDGNFAFHNSPFLDKRIPAGRLKIPLMYSSSSAEDNSNNDVEPETQNQVVIHESEMEGFGDKNKNNNVTRAKTAHQLVLKAKEWQQIALNNNNTNNNNHSSNMSLNSPSKFPKVENPEKKTDIPINSEKDSTKSINSNSGSNNNLLQPQPLGAKKLSSSRLAIPGSPRSRGSPSSPMNENSQSMGDQNEKATLLFHEYAGAASPADDWIVQTFQLLDPSTGMPAGPTVVRGYKTQHAVIRRERRVALAKSQFRQHELMLMQRRMSGVGGVGGASTRSGGAYGKRGSVLLDKYSMDQFNSSRNGINNNNSNASFRRGSLVNGNSGQNGAELGMLMGDGNVNYSNNSNTTTTQLPGVISNSLGQQRQLLPEEEVLRFKNPDLFSWATSQDLFELLAASTIVRQSFLQFRSSFIVRRNLRRMFVSVGCIQRFCRSLSRRRQSALTRILRDWRALEKDFVTRLRKYQPLEGDVIDGIVARNLADYAMTPEDEKKKRIEDAWRASRWEIAVAWRISSASGAFAKETNIQNKNSNNHHSMSEKSSASDDDDEDDAQAQNDNHDDHHGESSLRKTAKTKSNDIDANVTKKMSRSLTAAYDQWAKRHQVTRKRVFSYFISATPLFEAALRRLAIQCTFGANSVYRTKAMSEILTNAGCSIEQMHKRRAEIFQFEALVAEMRAKKNRDEEAKILSGELAMREGEKILQKNDNANMNSASADFSSSNFVHNQQAMTGRRGAVFQSPMTTSVNKTENPPFGEQSVAMMNVSLPPKPKEYDEGEHTAIQHVLKKEQERAEKQRQIEFEQQQQQQQKLLSQRNRANNNNITKSSTNYVAFGAGGESTTNNNHNNETKQNGLLLLPPSNPNQNQQRSGSISFLSSSSGGGEPKDLFLFSATGLAAQEVKKQQDAETFQQVKNQTREAIAYSRRKPFGTNPAPPWIIGADPSKSISARTAQRTQDEKNKWNYSLDDGDDDNDNNNSKKNKNRDKQNNSKKNENDNFLMVARTARLRSHVPILHMQPSCANLMEKVRNNEDDGDEEQDDRTGGNKRSFLPSIRNSFIIKNQNEKSANSGISIEQQQQNILRRGIVLPWIHREHEKIEKEKEEKNLKYRR